MVSQDRFTAERRSEEDIARLALRYRSKFGVSAKLYVDIIEILEFRVKELIPDFKLMIRRDLELEVTASTTFDPPRIFVRESIYDAALDGDFDARRILAHELGHLFLHAELEGSLQRDKNGYTKQFSSMSFLESAEAQADSFARHFLIAPDVAHLYRNDPNGLSAVTKTPYPDAYSAIQIAKRQDMVGLREKVRGKIRPQSPAAKLP